MSSRLVKASFAELQGFDADDCLEAFRVFRSGARVVVGQIDATRRAAAPSQALIGAACAALGAQIERPDAARAFFERHFEPFRVHADDGGEAGFLTGYYEPFLRASDVETPEFTAPALARPDDLGASAEPYPDRAAIESAPPGRYRPLLWLRDPTELFMAQVQGSARVEFPDGRTARLAYAGRNGQPYTSIGRELIASGAIPLAEMSLDRLKFWLRANGQAPGEAGRAIMWRNASYVFFKLEPDRDAGEGPTGGAGVPLTPFRAIAIDRELWPYGTPFWIDASLPWRSPGPCPFRKLTIALDTGSAIKGLARADLFFGGGDEAGRRAGDIRHPCRFTALIAREESA